MWNPCSLVSIKLSQKVIECYNPHSVRLSFQYLFALLFCTHDDQSSESLVDQADNFPSTVENAAPATIKRSIRAFTNSTTASRNPEKQKEDPVRLLVTCIGADGAVRRRDAQPSLLNNS